jgi:hypothetical protein
MTRLAPTSAPSRYVDDLIADMDQAETVRDGVAQLNVGVVRGRVGWPEPRSLRCGVASPAAAGMTL